MCVILGLRMIQDDEAARRPPVRQQQICVRRQQQFLPDAADVEQTEFQAGRIKGPRHLGASVAAGQQ
jgi:hypothetical protein